MLSLFRTARAHRGAVRPRLLVILTLLLAAVGPLWLFAQPPAWWAEKGVLNTNEADDYAVVNQGQVKHIAKQAYEAMKDASLIDLVADANTPLVEMWQTPAVSTDDYIPVNVGQLKFLAVPFYERLIREGIVSSYPWGASTDDYAWANIGQVKNVFGFSLVAPTELYYLTIVSGNNQVGESGQELPRPLKVRVTDIHGTPVSSQVVTFTVVSGGGLLSSAGATWGPIVTLSTGVLGDCDIPFKLGASAITAHVVTANAGGDQVVYNAFVKATAASGDGLAVAPPSQAPSTRNPGGAPAERPSYWEGSGEFVAPRPVQTLSIKAEHMAEMRKITTQGTDWAPDGTNFFQFFTEPKWNSPTLSWYPPTGGADEYVIERRANFGPWSQLGITNGGAPALGRPFGYEDTSGGLQSGALYEYRVFAIRNGVRSSSQSALYDLPAINTVTHNHVGVEDNEEGIYADLEGGQLNSVSGGPDWMADTHPWTYFIYDQLTAFWRIDYVVGFNDRAGAHVPWDWIDFGVSGGNLWRGDPISHKNRVVSNSLNPSESKKYMDFAWWAEFDYRVATQQLFKVGYRGRSLFDYTVVGSGIWLGAEEVASVSINAVYVDKIYPENGDVEEAPPVTVRVTWAGAGLSIYTKPTPATKSPVSYGASFQSDADTPDSVLYIELNDNALPGQSATITLAGLPPYNQPVYTKTFTVRFDLPSATSAGFNVPISESSGAKYRKIALNGAALSDEKPQQAEESDQAREETFIDALTLGLRHDTTDAYMAVPASDLALSARRSATTDIWRERRGIRPKERPDRPFGTGWTSNLAASIQFTKMIGSGADAIQNPDTATVTDENGAQFTFAIFYGEGTTYDSATGFSGPMTFVPIPTSRHEQSIHEISLVKNEGGYTFSRKFGSVLTYAMSGLRLALPSDRISNSNSGEEHTWARLIAVKDRYGNALEYEYGSSEFTLIPKEIKVHRHDGLGGKLSIRQNNHGLVTKIWDATGYEIAYTYNSTGDVHRLTSVKAADGATTSYSYELVEEERDVPASIDPHDDEPRFHFNLKSITDPLGQTYTFLYAYDETKLDYTSTPDVDGPLADAHSYIKPGVPRYVKKVTLPNNSAALFSHENSSVSLAPNEETGIMEFNGSRKTRVTDAVGNDRVYNFTSDLDDVEVQAMVSFASAYAKHLDTTVEPPRMIYYKTMVVTSYAGGAESGTALGSETFKFTPEAGMALASVTDFSGNETSYTYGETFANSIFVEAGLNAFFYGRYSDPTQQTNAMGGTKHFSYNADTRVMESATDENNTVTAWAVMDDGTGRRAEETITDNQGALLSHTAFYYKDMDDAYLAPGITYDDVSPNFITKKVVKRKADSTDPDWAVALGDLVTVYVPALVKPTPSSPPIVTSRVGKEIVDPDGLALTTTYTYDANGNKLTVTDARNKTTTFSYDKRHRLTHVTYHDGHQKRFFYDARGNKTQELDENGVATFWRYDALNRVRDHVIDMDGSLQAAYSATNALPASLTLDRSKHIVTSYTYNALNAKATVTDPEGTVTEFKYDALQRLIKKTEDFGTVGPNHFNYVTTYAYEEDTDLDDSSDLENDRNVGGSVFDSSSFKPRLITDARGYRTRITYDDLGRPLKEKVEYETGEFAETWKSYDAVGNLTQVIAPATTDYSGVITKTDYDALRRPVRVTEAFGTNKALVSETFYTSTGLAWRNVSDVGPAPNHFNYVTTTEYDAAGRPVKVFAPAVRDGLSAISTPVSPMTETIYDKASNVSAVINPLGARTDFAYDDRNRRWRERLPAVADSTNPGAPPSRPTRITAYDGVGNVIAVQDARGFVTTSEYDNARRPVIVTAPPVTLVDGRTVYPETRTKYDSAGNIVRLTDANGHVTTNTYDALNRLKSTTQRPDTVTANNITVTNEYDAAGNRTAVIDGKLQRTEFTYDGLNRNLTIKDPALRETEFVYDALNKTARIDSKNQRTEYTYDVRNRLTGVVYVEPGDTTPYAADRTYRYDNLSRLEEVTEPNNPAANVAYTYDALGRQLSETSNGKTHVYDYDLANNRVAVTYGGTDTVLLSTYDAHNRLETLSETQVSGLPPQVSRVTTYGYDLNGNRVFMELPNGEEVDTQYDPLNRAVAITTSKASGALLQQLTHAYDPVGNLVQLTERHFGSTSIIPRTVGNTYDNVNRLKAETVMQGATITSTAYTFDKANNRTQKVVTVTGGTPSTTTTDYVYNNLNQLQTATEGTTVTSFTYDLNGNRETRTKGGLTDTYAYDYENRLVTLDKDTADGTGTYAYVYDYRTRRVERTENATTTQLVFSGGVSVAEYPASSPAVASVEYIRGSDWGGGVGGLLYSIRGGVPSFKHYNSRGDVISATDDTGAATWQSTYEAFGTRTQEVGSTQDRQKANTKEEDPTGLLNEGFRYRCLETGVFITRDPLGFVDGPNMYAYVVQNPWSKFDPLGLRAQNEEEKKGLNKMRGVEKKVRDGATDLQRQSDAQRKAGNTAKADELGSSAKKERERADGLVSAIGKIEKMIKDSPSADRDSNALRVINAAFKNWNNLQGSYAGPNKGGTRTAGTFVGQNKCNVFLYDCLTAAGFDGKKLQSDRGNPMLAGKWNITKGIDGRPAATVGAPEVQTYDSETGTWSGSDPAPGTVQTFGQSNARGNEAHASISLGGGWLINASDSPVYGQSEGVNIKPDSVAGEVYGQRTLRAP